jgi:hypothetical protein
VFIYGLNGRLEGLASQSSGSQTALGWGHGSEGVVSLFSMMTAARKSSRGSQSLIVQGAPFLAFMLIGWFGLEQIVRSKRELRAMSSKGIDAVEEMDPVERMRRKYGLDSGSSGAQSRQERKAPVVPSLEEELAKTMSSINIKDFDYKPVPRPKDDEW